MGAARFAMAFNDKGRFRVGCSEIYDDLHGFFCATGGPRLCIGDHPKQSVHERPILATADAEFGGSTQDPGVV